MGPDIGDFIQTPEKAMKVREILGRNFCKEISDIFEEVFDVMDLGEEKNIWEWITPAKVQATKQRYKSFSIFDKALMYLCQYNLNRELIPKIRSRMDFVVEYSVYRKTGKNKSRGLEEKVVREIALDRETQKRMESQTDEDFTLSTIPEKDDTSFRVFVEKSYLRQTYLHARGRPTPGAYHIRELQSRIKRTKNLKGKAVTHVYSFLDKIPLQLFENDNEASVNKEPEVIYDMVVSYDVLNPETKQKEKVTRYIPVIGPDVRKARRENKSVGNFTFQKIPEMGDENLVVTGITSSVVPRIEHVQQHKKEKNKGKEGSGEKPVILKDQKHKLKNQYKSLTDIKALRFILDDCQSLRRDEYAYGDPEYERFYAEELKYAQCYRLLDAIGKRFGQDFRDYYVNGYLDIDGTRRPFRSDRAENPNLDGIVQVKDYIKYEKPNGYRSIHAVVRKNGAEFEIQIRTDEMHRHAESGSAKHKKFKHQEKERLKAFLAGKLKPYAQKIEDSVQRARLYSELDDPRNDPGKARKINTFFHRMFRTSHDKYFR